MINLIVAGASQDTALAFEPTRLVIAGWTGRDTEALEAHIAELTALGVAPPRSTPMFYRASTALLTTGRSIQVVGRESSGEVESVLFRHAGELFVGVGSDHTDRKLEAVGVTLSKQLCAKPLADTVWRWRDVADHWDEMRLVSTIEGGAPYQQGLTSALRRPDELMTLYEEREGPAPDGTVMFCGTLSVHGGIRFAPSMAIELRDPVLGRTLARAYEVDALPVAEA